VKYTSKHVASITPIMARTDFRVFNPTLDGLAKV